MNVKVERKSGTVLKNEVRKINAEISAFALSLRAFALARRVQFLSARVAHT